MNQQAEDLKTIRSLMEKSTKFQSFNGISIVYAGIFALLGAFVAKFYLLKNYEQFGNTLSNNDLFLLIFVALVVLLLSVLIISFFSWRKAKRKGQKLLAGPTLRAAYNLSIPLIAGGIFSFILLMRGNTELAIASCLIFYGLALVNASKYTFVEIHYLGIIELLLGLIAAYFLKYNLLIWALGFGLCHIIFGIIIYVKYDFKKQ